MSWPERHPLTPPPAPEMRRGWLKTGPTGPVDDAGRQPQISRRNMGTYRLDLFGFPRQEEGEVGRSLPVSPRQLTGNLRAPEAGGDGKEDERSMIYQA